MGKAVSRAKPKKKPALARAKESALEQIDQVLLGLQHSSLAKFSSRLKKAEPSDLFMMVGRKVLEQVEAVRATLPESSQVLESVRMTAKKPFRAAARVANVKAKKSKAKKK